MFLSSSLSFGIKSIFNSLGINPNKEILLQLLDDGILTDSQNHKVNFKNTVIILTSNLGSDVLLNGISEDGEILPKIEQELNVLLKKFFRPEFLNRLDEIVFYRPLSKENFNK